MPSFKRRYAVAPLLALAAISCDRPVTEAQHQHSMPAFAQVSAGQLSGLAKDLRQYLARFNSTEQAARAGYVIDSPCISAPPGAMGFHFVNHALVDPVFDPLQPEALLYGPTKNGKYTLLGVEYIVIDVGQPAPTFDGQAFDVGGSPVPVAHWTLHVWVNQANPSGMFAPFNPDVTCS